MDTKLATRQIRLREWAGIIKDRMESGMNVNAYCEQQGLSRDAYSYWLRKVKEAALEQAGFVELPVAAPVSTVKAPSFTPQLVIRTHSVELCMNADTPEELITKALNAVRHAQ